MFSKMVKNMKSEVSFCDVSDVMSGGEREGEEAGLVRQMSVDIRHLYVECYSGCCRRIVWQLE